MTRDELRRSLLRLRARAARETRARLAAARDALGIRAPAPVPAVRLEDVRRRLELLLAAIHGREIRVDATKARPGEGLLHRLVYGKRADAGADVAVADGECVRLPATVDVGPGGPAAALARYRLLALQQAERVVRATAACAPAESEPLERDLYLVCEAAAVDQRIARTLARVRPALAGSRAAALASRPMLEGYRPLEREIEGLVRAVLAHDAAEPPPGLPDDATPEQSRAWARATADRLRVRHPDAALAYRGIPLLGVWGAVSAGETEERGAGGPLPVDIGSRRVGRGPGEPGEAPDAPASTDGRLVVDASRGAPADAPGERVQHPALDPDDAASGVVDPDGPGDGARHDGVDDVPAGGIAYPEWDPARRRLVPRAAVVIASPAEEGDGAWAARVLGEHAALVRRVRGRFERLRARRTRLGRQRDGEELDLDACVRALADRRAGGDADDRLYVAVRPARRALAIALLVDVSGSTDTDVDADRRVIDVEKEAVLLAGEALDALGDRYAVLTFSSRGARAVRVTTIKDFAERGGDVVRRRLDAVKPAANTRLGAAVRHATERLVREPAGHRLLLVLSDGKPNDTDGYHGRRAVEDSRQAVLEARARGVYPHCLTVDTEEPEYLSHVFGEAGHTILRRADQLPLALVGVVRQLLGGR